MSFRSYQKEINKKREQDMVLRSLENIESVFKKRKDDYAKMAMDALKEGNKSQYIAYVSLLKNAMFNLAQAQDMTANFIIARDLRNMMSVNKNFVNSINRVMKDVYKISKSIKVEASRKIFDKALVKQGYTATQLKQLLEDNSVSFQSSVNSLSDISDSEIKSVLEAQIKNEEKDFSSDLEKLEAEFLAPQPQTQSIRQAVVEGAPQSEIKKEVKVSAEPKRQTVIDKKFDVDGIAFRPKRLDDYIGQPNAVETLKPAIKMAKLSNKPLSHILLCGSFGQGKTTLAKIIANEMNGNFTTISSKVSFKDMQKTLRAIKAKDIIFIDEIHKLSDDIVEALLYPAMEDYEMNVNESVNGRAKATTIKLPPFTLIGATTETGKLLKPFYSKFPLNVTLQDYETEVIAAIVKNSFSTSYIKISDEFATDIAKRSKNSPRYANAHVKGIGDRTLSRLSEKHNLADGALEDKACIEKLNAEVTREDIEDYFKWRQIDEMGLSAEERKILQIIIEKYQGGPVGLTSLTKALNMTDNRVDQEYEPYLVKLGFINIRPQGRYATEAAYKYLGYDGEQKPTEAEPEDDELPVIEAVAGEYDAEAAEWISELFSGDGVKTEAALDNIFAGADKTYDSIAKNRCILRVGNNDLYCDSVLERKFLALLFAKGYITDARSEALELEYASAKMSGKTYYPDFVLKLHDGTVAILEMKNFTSMGNHLNMAKYEALKEYCRNHGFKYAEVAKYGKRYVSAQQLLGEQVNDKLRAFVSDKINECGSCTLDDLKEFGYDERELVVLLLNDKTLKNVDRTGGNPQIISAVD